SASKSTDSVGVALPESLCLRTQTRKVSLLSPSSFATRVIAPFAVSGSAWAWMTSSTARALSSSVYFTGKRESPSSNLPASIIPGAIHGISIDEQLSPVLVDIADVDRSVNGQVIAVFVSSQIVQHMARCRKRLAPLRRHRPARQRTVTGR